MDHIASSMTIVHGATLFIADKFYYSRKELFCIFIHMNMKSFILSVLSVTALAFANVPANTESTGIPWNREFDSNQMMRHQTFDPALKVAYTYSLNFAAGSFGSMANQSLMGHFAYEFAPNLHLYANVGLWMPIYANISNGSKIAREDLRQGNFNLLVPDVALEYKPSENVMLRVSYVNERDALKAYGPRNFFHNDCSGRASLSCR